MAKLNQIIAIEKGIKASSYAVMTEQNKIVQKPELFNGFQKEYQKIDEAGEDLPAESKRAQFQISEVLNTVERAMTDLITVTARKDWTNCAAVADIVIDEATVVTRVPVSHLLFLEKQLNDLHTLVSNVPVLDLGEDWTFDANSGLHKSRDRRTHRTKKTQRPIVLYDATTEHPAQTQLITEDILAGHWVQVQHSGAMPSPRKKELLLRIIKLIRATKEAREAANARDEVTPPDVAKSLFNYLLPQETTDI